MTGESRDGLRMEEARTSAHRGASAPAEPAGPGHPDGAMDVAHEDMPRRPMTRRAIVALAVFLVVSLAVFYFVLPKLTGLRSTWNRINNGDPGWLGAAAALELLSFLGYVALFRAVFVRRTTRVGWRESYQITMAGLAATRLFASAGAGGIALTAWALRRSGMERRVVAVRMIAFTVLLYSVYMATLVLDGIGLRTGMFGGHAPFGFTVIPAIFGAVVIVLLGAITLLPAGFERRLQSAAQGSGRVARLLARSADGPASVAEGTRAALSLLRSRDPALLGALAWWGFDIAVLWASFHAFGQSPPWSVIVMCYFVGMLANVLPLPGGVGGVEGGMVAAFLAFDVSGSLALVSVITYRAFSFWLPTVPGALAYWQLRHTVAGWQADGSGRLATPGELAS